MTKTRLQFDCFVNLRGHPCTKMDYISQMQSVDIYLSLHITRNPVPVLYFTNVVKMFLYIMSQHFEKHFLILQKKLNCHLTVHECFYATQDISRTMVVFEVASRLSLESCKGRGFQSAGDWTSIGIKSVIIAQHPSTASRDTQYWIHFELRISRRAAQMIIAQVSGSSSALIQKQYAHGHEKHNLLERGSDMIGFGRYMDSQRTTDLHQSASAINNLFRILYFLPQQAQPTISVI